MTESGQNIALRETGYHEHRNHNTSFPAGNGSQKSGNKMAQDTIAMDGQTSIIGVTSTIASDAISRKSQKIVSSISPETIGATSQTKEVLKDVVFGSTAGMVGKVIEYPFDTVKVRLQSSNRYSGPIDCFAQSWRTEGIAGLYRGLSAPMFGAAVETGCLFFSYRLAQEAFRQTTYKDSDLDGGQLPFTVLVTCGALSGAFTSTVLTPIELVKCQMQVPADSYNAGRAGAQGASQRSVLGVIGSVYRHGGFMGFFHGHLGTLIRETGGSAAWFGAYEGATALFRKHGNKTGAEVSEATIPKDAASPVSSSAASLPSLPIWQQMVSGACAGVSYNFLFFPADTIKSRMQTAEVGGSASGQRPSFLAVGKMILREQGIKGMYRGCGITVARSAPASGFIFTVNETLRTYFG